MNRWPSTWSKSIPGAAATPVRSSNSRTEGRGIVGQVGDVGVHVERAVGGREPVDAQPAQPVEQQPAVRPRTG